MAERPDIDAIWNEYGRRLRRFLASRAPVAADVDDLLQEILLKTHRNLDSLQDPARLQSWLFQVARNALIDLRRRNAARQAELLSGAEADPGDGLEDYERTRRELSGCVASFIERLPDKYRDAVTAVDLQGESQKALAQRLGLSHSAAKSRVQRGRSMVRELLTACCDYEFDARGNVSRYLPRSGKRADRGDNNGAGPR